MFIGNEELRVCGQNRGISVNDFWRWAHSDLTGPEFAEFLVMASLTSCGMSVWHERGCNKGYDILTNDGTRVDVRAAAYTESRTPEHPDFISFRLSPANSTGRTDAYVFCTFKGMTAKADRLNMDDWDFYAIRAATVDEAAAGRNSITLPVMLDLKPFWSDFYGIGIAIQKAMTA